MPFAVNGAEARPHPVVTTVILAVVLLNTPDGPFGGAVNVTLIPDTGLPPASFTLTPSALAKAVLSAALCGVAPALGVIAAAGPTEFVREKLTGERPAAAALTA